MGLQLSMQNEAQVVQSIAVCLVFG